MISIKKDFHTLPERLVKSGKDALILDAIATKNNHAFDTKVYRACTLDTLIQLYGSKCAYCETNTAAGAPMQVEHYRPKAKVQEDKKHLGYYWIAYEWSNLILSCSKCNNKKRNRFPILGQRVATPTLDTKGLPVIEHNLADSASLTSEQPLLIHPEVDDVESHFIFKPNGEIQGLDQKAQTTISVCDLNRSELVSKRLKILNKIIADIKETLSEVLEKKVPADQCRFAMKNIFRNVTYLQHPSNEYSRFGYFVFTKFEHFVANSLEEKQRQAVQKLFAQFLNNEL